LWSASLIPSTGGSRLATDTVHAVMAGRDVLIEQVSTINRDGHEFVSIVCLIFSLEDGRISANRA
jgi:hypothetical protein